MGLSGILVCLSDWGIFVHPPIWLYAPYIQMSPYVCKPPYIQMPPVICMSHHIPLCSIYVMETWGASVHLSDISVSVSTSICQSVHNGHTYCSPSLWVASLLDWMSMDVCFDSCC